jgi:hypothetical protein
MSRTIAPNFGILAFGIGMTAIFAALVASAIVLWIRNRRIPRLTLGWTVTLVLVLTTPGPGAFGLSSGLLAFLVMVYASLQVLGPRLTAWAQQPRV